ncbi:hypothetical protein RJ640_005843 [Escallonia rubra]|uniref:SWIM-type domain-containing protein n=1 Tax=Escallonia rubra TaxID=112253 RepID=A0AA88RXA5_9ASTE|nr:hypothetical protein RJ640_005843 [Escallonia rubra]
MSFKDQTSQDPSFFHVFQLDNEEQITNIFWADGRMRMDYELFGDIVTFDTTFATNKDHRPLGVFIGFNHYREQVIFGASLLYDETQASFNWVFSTFFEAHDFKKPTTLFTDQDIAMGNAISVVMPEVRHGLCTFHIMQNAIKHLGNLMKDDSCFLSDFKALMFEYEDVTKFEKEWEALLKKYSWLERTYALKEKWARCYMKTTVTLGVRTGKVYTPKIFELFQRQWEKSLLALVGNKQERGRLQEYLIVSCDEDGEYVMTHDEENATLSCSCNNFETVGILCGHALKVLDVLGIKYIPETYILKRWTRGARDDCALDEDGLDVHRSGALDVSDRYRELWPDAVRLAHKASEFKDGYLLYKTKMKELDKEIEELRKKHYECTDHGCEPNGNKGVDKNAIESLVGNVKGITKRDGPQKGESKRHKSWVEKQPKKRKQMMTNSLGCPNHDKENQDPSLPREASLDDTLLSSLSQGSNRAQFNGKKVMGEFNMLGSNHIQSGGERGERVFGDLNVLSRAAAAVYSELESRTIAGVKLGRCDAGSVTSGCGVAVDGVRSRWSMDGVVLWRERVNGGRVAGRSRLLWR